jgi:uncharacterized protein
MNRSDFTPLGFGVGLRRPHYLPVLDNHPRMDWFEVTSENFMVEGGRPIEILEEIRSRYPIVMHGVALSIGSADPLNFDYLRQLSNLARRFEPAWISDHLCWTGVGGRNLHDLLPLPYVEDTVRYVAQRIRWVQDILERTILVENISSYLEFSSSQLSEWEFLSAVAEEADCGILLDINNIFVNAFNHRFDPVRYIDSVPTERVIQFHLAGHAIMAPIYSTLTTSRFVQRSGRFTSMLSAVLAASRPSSSGTITFRTSSSCRRRRTKPASDMNRL